MSHRKKKVILNVLFIKENNYYSFHEKIWSSTTLFNINNNSFLSRKSAYYYDFWRSCDTEYWSNDAENTALITGIITFKNIQIEKSNLIKL